MNRNTISTGKKHQEEVAVWVRRRLADSHGGQFDTGRSRLNQHGVILADGVGLGKTWEALAASALILVESSKERWDGSQRKSIRQQPARVLVVCPPGLVSKWTREIRDPEGFSVYLKRWANANHRRAFVLDTLREPYEIRLRSDLADLDPGRIRFAQVELPAGTYVCNWNVLRKKIGSGRSRLAALRSQSWGVLIVDEAHHREAREAIATVQQWSRGILATLLLTATPFQLDPRELHQLMGAVLDRRHGEYKVLSREPVRRFVEGLSQFFDGSEAPSASLKRQVEQTLGQAIVRSKPLGRGRRFHVINEHGFAATIEAPDKLYEEKLRELTELFVAPSAEFETWYLRRRLQLAGGEKTCVPNKLCQALSTVKQAALANQKGPPPPHSPRVESLVAWARTQIQKDLERAADDGYPRKLLVFTHFVKRAAGDLRERLEEAAADAWRAVRATPKWSRMSDGAVHGIDLVTKRLEKIVKRSPPLKKSSDVSRLIEQLHGLASAPDSPFKDLFGQRKFRRLVLHDLTHHLDALAVVLSSDRDDGSWARLHREERKGLRATIEALAESRIAATYTGHDDRRNREAVGEGFRSPLAPWVLVASNVGSEGIDLHNFSAHLVHFDIEWNPARMEQREGRSDRLGRVLRDPVNIYYVLVRGTYDERMCACPLG